MTRLFTDEAEYHRLWLFVYRATMLILSMLILIFLFQVMDGLHLRAIGRCESLKVGDVAVWQYDHNQRMICTHHDYSVYRGKYE